MKTKLFSISMLALALATPAMAQAATITVNVTGIKKAVGRLFVSICDKRQYEARGCSIQSSAPAKIEGVTMVFDNVPTGRYVVTVYQDVNGNGKLDLNWIGIPDEPGALNGPKPMFFPSFDAAAFDVSTLALTFNVGLWH